MPSESASSGETPRTEKPVDRKAFEKELVSLRTPLRHFAISLTKNMAVADDLVQTTMEKALKNWKKYGADTNMRAWTFMILRNTFYSNFRKAKHEVEDVEGGYSSRLSEEDKQIHKDALAEVAKYIAFLPEDQRAVLMLIAEHDTPYKEIAGMLHIEIGTVKSRAHRARLFLRAAQLASKGLTREEIIKELGVTSRTEMYSVTRAMQAFQMLQQQNAENPNN